MSGLYNVVFGNDPNAELFLHMVGLTNFGKIPRFRDAFVHKEYIVIYTRTGGANRADYEEGIEYLRSSPQFSHDEDDSFDNTYALFYYTIPPAFKEGFDKNKAALHRELPAVRWKQYLDNLRKNNEET